MIQAEEEHTEGKPFTVSAMEAQYKALIFSFTAAVVFGSPYWFVWGKAGFGDMPSGLIVFALLIGGILVHELIHGVTWALFAEKGFSSIKFGVMWKALTPYCHCSEALKLSHYRLGAVMPGIILGVIPLLVSTLNASLGWYLFGLIFLIAAGGDFLILWMLRKEPSGMYALDHPEEVGCLLYGTKPVQED